MCVLSSNFKSYDIFSSELLFEISCKLKIILKFSEILILSSVNNI